MERKWSGTTNKTHIKHIVHIYYMPKTITIRDSTYELFSKFKGKNSFSDAIEELLRIASKKDKEILLKYFGASKRMPAVERNKEVRNVEALR